MKKLYLFILLVLPICLMAEEYEVITKDGTKYYGEYVSNTDTTFTISTKKKGEVKDYCFSADVFVSAHSYQGGEFKIVEGKIVGKTYQEAYAQFQKEEADRIAELYSNPNYVSGHAMATIGGVSLGMGVPSLIVGSVLCALGNKEPKTNILKDPDGYKKEQKNKNNMIIAGCVLAGAGGALTLISLPLIVHGKRVMNVKVKVDDNGAGLVLNI